MYRIYRGYNSIHIYIYITTGGQETYNPWREQYPKNPDPHQVGLMV